MEKMNAISSRAVKAFAILAGLALFVVIFYAAQWTLTWSTRSDALLGIFILVAVAFYGAVWVIRRFGKGTVLFIWSILRSVFLAIGRNPDVQRIIQRHPKFSRWLRERFDPRTFSGSTASVLAVAFAYVAVLLAGVVWDVSSSNVVVAADRRMTVLLALFRAPRIISASMWITAFGGWPFVLAAASCVIGLLRFRKRPAFILPFLAGLGGAAVSAEAIKRIVHRQRPAFGAIVEDQFSSFPSAHATLAFIFYGFLVYLAWKTSVSWKKRFDVFFAAVAIVALIGFSRLYLGVHYPSDVWAGYLLGALWLVIAIGISESAASCAALPAVVIGKRARPWPELVAFIVAFVGLILTVGFERPVAVAEERAPAVQTIPDAGLLLFGGKTPARFTETLIAEPQEPISMIVLAHDDEALISAFRDAGWSLADPITPSTVANLMSAAIVSGAYAAAPMTPSFWNGKVHDLGFEKPAESGGIRKRHHVRFWKTEYRTTRGETVYVGAASLDIGIKWFVTHRIAPDIDTERSFLIRDLKAAGRVADAREEDFIPPSLGKNFARDLFFTDGKIEIIRLGAD